MNLIKNQSGTYKSAISTIIGGILIGSAFGLVVSLVSNCFVIGVKTLTDFRENSLNNLPYLKIADFSLAPVIALLVAAVLVILIKRMLGVQR